MTTSHEFAAAAYVLLEPPSIRDRAVRYVDWENDEIDFTALLEAATRWSHREQLLVRVAWDLWNGGGETLLAELITTLDEPNLQLVLDAVAIRRGFWVPDEVEVAG